MHAEEKVRTLPTPEHLKERFAEYIRQKDAVYNSDATGRDGRSDVYKDAEPVIRSMMNIFYGLNLKMEGECNASGFDLYDAEQNVMVQVTHNQNKPEKVKNCLSTTSQRVTKENLGTPKLYIAFLDKDSVKDLAASTKNKMQQEGREEVRGRYDFPITVDFDPENNILNLDSFLIMLQNDQDAYRKGLSNAAKWKLVDFLSGQGILIDIPGNPQRIILPPLSCGEERKFTLAMLKTVLEYITDEPFEDDEDFLERLLPTEIREVLPDIVETMHGEIGNKQKTEIARIIRCHSDTCNDLLRRCSRLEILQQPFHLACNAIRDYLGDSGNMLGDCIQICVGRTSPYIAVAMYAVFALLSPKRFASLVNTQMKARQYFYSVSR